MSVIRKMRKQKAVYWAPVGLNAYGRPTLAAPVEVSCRWDDAVEEYLDKDGNTQMSEGIVYPDRILLLGGVLWKGKITELLNQTNPFGNPGAWPIGKFQQIPNFKNSEVLYIAHVGESRK